MNLFGNCTCPSCELETRFLLEIGQDEGFYLVGDELDSHKVLSDVTECDYCQHAFTVHAISIEGVLSAFLTQSDFESYLTGELAIAKAPKKAGLEQEKGQKLKQFHESFSTPFEEQPFEPGQTLQVDKHEWVIERVYKKEGVETDLTKRLITPTLDEYWYEVKNKTGEKKWCIVTDTQYEHLFTEKQSEKRTIASEIKRVSDIGEWYELEQQEDEDEETREVHNAILTIEAPFLKENEQKFDVTDTMFQTTLLFDKKLTENLSIKAYQYLAGVRFFVVNNEGELELDLFGDSAENLLDLVQEELSISVEEY